MELVKKIESKLGELYKSAPALSKPTKKSLADAWPWVALVIGVLQLFAAYSLWKFMDDYAAPLFNYVNQYSQLYGGPSIGLSAFDKTVIYVAIAFAVVQAVLFVLAFKPLQAKAKRGWDLFFLATLANVAYAIVTLFVDNRGFGSVLGLVIGSAIGFYFLFQIRELYTGKTKPATPVQS